MRVRLFRVPSHENALKEDFLAMTFVHGPEEAVFLEGKTAKLRFFLGYVDEFEPEDGSGQMSATTSGGRITEC